MLDLFLASGPIVRPVALMLIPGLIAWLAWNIARRSGGVPSPPGRDGPAPR